VTLRHNTILERKCRRHEIYLVYYTHSGEGQRCPPPSVKKEETPREKKKIMSGIFDMVSGVLYMLRIPFARTLPRKTLETMRTSF
jgi:hypothetical protein